MGILSHDNLDIGHNGKRVFLINQSIGSSSEHNIGDKLGLLIYTMMLSNRYCYSKMVVLKIRSNILVSQHYVYAYDSVLRVFGALKKDIDINVLDSLKLCLASLDLTLIFLIFRDFSLNYWLSTLRIRFTTLCCSCLRIRFSWWGRLSWCFLFLFLLVFFFRLSISTNSS
jgi:hypothetical protein